MNDLMAAAPDFDAERLDATTDQDIQIYKAAEGYPPDYRPIGPVLTVPSVSELREQMGLTQEACARLLRIPVATLRNWEQGRKTPDPAAQTLLILIAADPAYAQRILSGGSVDDCKHIAASGAEPEPRSTFAQIIDIASFEPANLNLTISDVRALA